MDKTANIVEVRIGRPSKESRILSFDENFEIVEDEETYGFLEQQLFLFAAICDGNPRVKDLVKPLFPFKELLLAVSDEKQHKSIRIGLLRICFEIYIDPFYLAQFNFTRIHRHYDVQNTKNLRRISTINNQIIASMLFIIKIYIVADQYDKLTSFVLNSLATATTVT